jgi:glycosyltransferase involved in cell wall biosynthesis
MHKILIIDNGEHLGGGQTIALHVIECLINENIQIGIGLDKNSSLWRKVQESFGFVELHHIEVLRLTKGKKRLSDILRLFKHMINNLKNILNILCKYDCIYINSARSLITVGLCCIFLRKPFIVHVHLLHKINELFVIGCFSKLKYCFRVVACSALVEKRLIEFCGRKVVKINNCLGVLSVVNVKTKNPISSHRIGFFGELSFEKGFDLFIEMATSLPYTDFVAVGVPSDKKMLLSHKIPSNLTILHPVDNITNTINALGITVVIMPSRVKESFGMVAIESVAAGCLVVVSGKGYLYTLANDLKLSICEDLNQYLECLNKLLELDLNSLSELVEQSQKLVFEIYGHERFKLNIVNLIIRDLFEDRLFCNA